MLWRVATGVATATKSAVAPGSIIAAKFEVKPPKITTALLIEIHSHDYVFTVLHSPGKYIHEAAKPPL